MEVRQGYLSFIVQGYMKITDYLKTPFPRPARNRKNLLWVIAVGLSASIFILLYKPFGIENTTGELFVDLIIFSLGILFIFSVLFMEWIIPGVFPKWFRNWTLGKALLWYTLVLVFIALVNFLYKSYWSNFLEFTWIDFLMVLGRTFIISITVCFFVLGIWQYVNRRKMALISANETYRVTTLNSQEMDLKLKDTLYISSDDNYVDIHYLSGGERKKLVLRSSLKNIEKQVTNPLSPIHRCHRRYLINIAHFKIKDPRSRSMLVGLKDYQDELPVSKQYSRSIRKLLSIRP